MEIVYNNNPGDARQVPDRLIPKPSCGSCIHYDGSRCRKNWNDMETDGFCDEYEWDQETFEGDDL